MKIEVDTHTHTVASGHAYSTLKENAQAAFERGLKGFVVADHGPGIPGAGPAFALASTLASVPDEIEGVRMIRGAEADILDTNGALDIPDRYLACTQFAIASLHSVTFAPSDMRSNTDAMLAALNNPWIDVIGHPGNPKYPIDYEALVLEARRLGKLIEINNHSFEYRTGSEPNCTRIIQLCRRHSVPVVVSSDAHCCYRVGSVDSAARVLNHEEFPQELVLNGSLERFLAYTEASRKHARERQGHGA